MTAWIKLFLIFAIVLFTADGYSTRFVEFAASENPLRNRAIFLLIWAISIYLILAVAFLKPLAIRIIFAILMTISTFFAEAYKAITTISLTYGDMYSLWISRGDWKSAFLNYWQSTLIAIGVSLFLFIVIIYPFNFGTKKYRIVQWSKYIFIIPIVMIFFMISKKGGAAAIGLPEQIKPIAMLTHIIYFEATNDFDMVRKSVEISPSPSASVLPHLVLIIDESVRGDFLSINNPAARTTPFLESVSNGIANFGYASSTHNCSHYANANLRYGTHSSDLRNSLLANPSIWEYAKKAGYHTTYLDAQRRHGELQNLMSPRERRAIDDFIQFSDVDAVERAEPFIMKDQRAAKLLNILLSRDTPQFILVNKEGVHAPYEGKYPEHETKFTPTMSLAESIRPGLSRIKLVNSYKNSIAWAVDKFFEVLLLDSTFLKTTIVFYTGDHGQNLLDKGITTHCGGDRDPPNVVALVPLFIMTENSFFRSAFQDAAKRNIHKASHFNIFSTILWAMGYTKDDYNRFHDPSLIDNLDGVRYWFTGDILKNDANQHLFNFGIEQAEPDWSIR